MFPATTQASRDTPKEERKRVPSYDEASRDTQGRGEREKERKREGEREGEERKEGVPSYEQSSRDTPKKERGDPEYSIQENPRKQRKKGEGKGEEGGLRLQQVPMNLETGFDRYGRLVPCRNGWLLRPLRSRSGMSQLRIPKMGQNHRTYGLGHLRSLRAALYPGRGYVGHTPVRRVHGRHSAGSSRVGT